MRKEYPKWIYRRGADGKVESLITANGKEHKEKYQGWAESPADLEDAPPIGGTGEANLEPLIAVPTIPVLSEELKALAAEAESALQSYYKAPTVVITGRVKKMTDPADVREIRELEENRPGGARESILKALADRLGELAAPAAESEAAPALA